jgi:hypothetical protein
MKKLFYNLFLLVLALLIFTINGVQYVKDGVYIDVIPSCYNLYLPLEHISNGYIQIDSNK